MDQENLRRWRLVLGGDKADDGIGIGLNGEDVRIDRALGALYDGGMLRRRRGSQGAGSGREGGDGASCPNVSTWLGDIRDLFPQTVVSMMQNDAVNRLGMRELLTEREMLENVVPDVNMVATLLSLGKLIPEKNKDVARQVVRKVVDELMQKLATPMQQAVTGALNRSARKRNPRLKEIDWPTTIRKNLKNYQPDYKTVIPEVLVGFGRKGRKLKDIVLCLDQSGSMSMSVVYSGIFGSVLASMPSVTTKMVAFDTSVVDLTEDLQDPVDILFGVQLGGGTDIAKALTYTKSIITRPQDTILVVITDLYECGDTIRMKRRFAELAASGVQVVVLLALSDEGAPFYHQGNAEYLASLGIPSFACTPDKFPDLMAAVINKQDLGLWVSQNIDNTTKN